MMVKGGVVEKMTLLAAHVNHEQKSTYIHGNVNSPFKHLSVVSYSRIIVDSCTKYHLL